MSNLLDFYNRTARESRQFDPPRHLYCNGCKYLNPCGAVSGKPYCEHGIDIERHNTASCQYFDDSHVRGEGGEDA